MEKRAKFGEEGLGEGGPFFKLNNNKKQKKREGEGGTMPEGWRRKERRRGFCLT
jgi:hypothetical protein